MVSVVSNPAFDARQVAARFVAARRAGGSLAEYPGPVPADLDAAYRCQDEAIALWQDAIAGWKVGWIPEPFSRAFGANRLVGPIFRGGILRPRNSDTVDAPIFAGGFAAVEAEFVIELGADAPRERLDWTPEQAGPLVRALHVGMEIASSPLRNINDHGPAVIASDFGNNAGLLLGPEVPDWQRRPLEGLVCETRIDGTAVGRADARAVSGGPLAALAFALALNARRGRPLRAGDWISTGAVTGVHPIRAGQLAEASFTGLGHLRCRAVPMTPEPRG